MDMSPLTGTEGKFVSNSGNPGPDESLLKQVASYIRDCRRLVILTGAGVSKESGIPTFRDKLTGLWEGYDPTQLATPEGFLKDPHLVWRWYDWRRKIVSQA